MSGNGQYISYKYNDSGIRTVKTVNGVVTKYHLVGDKVTYEDNGTDKIYYTYDSANDLVSMNLNGVEYYYIRNAQGDIIGLFDKDGTQVVSYSYDSWGKLISIDGSLKDSVGVKNPYRYRGYRYDTETGLYYLNSRYYNPELGRFINADALAGKSGELLSHNVFAYCKNNPINNFDDSGYKTVSIGFSLSGSIFWSTSVSIFLSFGKENAAIQWSYSGTDSDTASFGIYGVGATGFLSFTDANDVDDLNGKSFQAGGTAGANFCAGVDAIKFPTSHNVIDGIQFCGGYGFGIDGHVQQTRTRPIKSFKNPFCRKTIKPSNPISHSQRITSGGGGHARALSW